MDSGDGAIGDGAISFFAAKNAKVAENRVCFVLSAASGKETAGRLFRWCILNSGYDTSGGGDGAIWDDAIGGGFGETRPTPGWCKVGTALRAVRRGGESGCGCAKPL